MGITLHIASILGSWGATSPTYFPSPADLDYANGWMLELQRAAPDRIAGYVAINPNFQKHALEQVDHYLGEGMVGIKLAASRRADDPLLDPVCRAAAEHRVPILQHVWQHRRRDWPGQEASDAAELVTLAERHPDTNFILAHIAGGGDWRHSLRAVREVENVHVDLSGSGVDGGLLEACLEAVGVGRLVWGADITLDTGLAKLRHLEHVLEAGDMDRVRWGNAAQLFRLDVNTGSKP
jgi:predicted TIM-barrel fold metal-dependent hydrolase